MILDDENIIYPEFNDCVAGTCIRFGQPPIVIYDYDKVIQKLMSDGLTTEEDAIEWFDFNTIGAWVGETTPAFLIRSDSCFK